MAGAGIAVKIRRGDKNVARSRRHLRVRKKVSGTSTRPRLAVLGFTKAIGQYMAAAEVVMGKAGPNVLMEAVAPSSEAIYAAITRRFGARKLAELQDMLYAQDRWGVLAIFQAMDAAGKDGAIKHVMSGVNPQGCEVHAFKAPSS